MSRPVARVLRADSGFTLLEAVVAIALMGLIVGTLATVTAQWLPNWKRGLFRVQRNEQLAIALDRLVADLSAAEYVSGNRINTSPLFDGTESGVTFVRSALGPNTSPGLEIVRIAEAADSRGPILVRTRAPFVPLPAGDLSVDPIPFADPVVLLRAPFRLAFSYAAANGKWSTTWRGQGVLPSAVRFSVEDVTDDRAVVVATATRIHVDLMAPKPPSPDQQPTPSAQGAAQAQRGNPAGGAN